MCNHNQILSTDLDSYNDKKTCIVMNMHNGEQIRKIKNTRNTGTHNNFFYYRLHSYNYIGHQKSQWSNKSILYNNNYACKRTTNMIACALYGTKITI